jgi:hypothetical protein
MLAKLSFQAPEINPFHHPHFSTFSFSHPSPSQNFPENPPEIHLKNTHIIKFMDDAHAYELIRCVCLFPGDAQGEDVLAADYRRSGLAKKNAALKNALDVCLEVLHPRFLLEPERLVPVPQSRKLREELLRCGAVPDFGTDAHCAGGGL